MLGRVVVRTGCLQDAARSAKLVYGLLYGVDERLFDLRHRAETDHTFSRQIGKPPRQKAAASRSIRRAWRAMWTSLYVVSG